MPDGSQKLESPSDDADKDYISTLFIELGQARAIVDLLFMVAAGKAVDSIDGMASDTLSSSLHIALQRLDAAQDAADAMLAEGRLVGVKKELLMAEVATQAH